MNALLKQAFARVQALPPNMQEEAARLLLIYAGEEGPMVELSAEEHADLLEAQREMARGEFATDAEIRAVFDKYRA